MASIGITCAMSIAQASGGDAPTVLERFLARHDPPPTQYRALRHLDARSEHFGASAWMDAWTEVDAAGGFRFQIIAEGGSGYNHSHVLTAALAGEQQVVGLGHLSVDEQH